jgi:hypothetical protein
MFRIVGKPIIKLGVKFGADLAQGAVEDQVKSQFGMKYGLSGKPNAGALPLPYCARVMPAWVKPERQHRASLFYQRHLRRTYLPSNLMKKNSCLVRQRFVVSA